jgi:hypothetical protein
MTSLQLLDLVLRCAPHGRPPTLRFGHRMCTMWHSYNPLIWPWDVCHLEGQQRLDMTVGRPPHGKPHPSDMVVGCATCGKTPALRYGLHMFITWHTFIPHIYPLYVSYVVGPQPSDMVVICAPCGRPPTLRSGRRMCTMW